MPKKRFELARVGRYSFVPVHVHFLVRWLLCGADIDDDSYIHGNLFAVVRSPGAWLSQGQKLGLYLPPTVFLYVGVTVFNIYRTTVTSAS